MPKISDTTREARRRHVLESAWRCFSRNGFHLTTMDEIIAETGMSSSSVYRYFAGKDDLIDAAAEESLGIAASVLAELGRKTPVPSPRDTLAQLVNGLRRQQSGTGYDLTKITVNAWGEALRRPQMHTRAYRFYNETHTALVTLAQRWCDEGVIPADSDPDSIAGLLVTLMPGMLVMNHLYELPSPDGLAEGIALFAAAREGAR
jgi:AcrR family transcriptional regulator